ncbi:MAG: riboflavin synthase [Legionellaceae bacterium]|nr:riboflavin synthase [Legionellaceae bacterium]
MFTGLIEACGTLLSRVPNASGMRLVFETNFDDLLEGESIAVNGVCLTWIPSETGLLAFDVSPETDALTNLGHLQVGDKVNLERSLRASDRIGGHYVSGHVDTTATLLRMQPQGDYIEMEIDGFTPEHMRYLCRKGSVALDGVSLTINAIGNSSITVMLIPHTLAKTTLSTWQAGQNINVEFDYIARVVVHQLGSLSDSTILSLFARPNEGKEVLV